MTSTLPTRRQALRAAAATLAAPLIVPARVLSRNAPSNRIVVGQIGFGWIGENHISTLLGRLDVTFLGVCDIKSDLRRRTRERVDNHYARAARSGQHRAAVEFHDFRDMIADPRIDAVVIAVPDHWHAIMTILAARAGKDIYCEKPISLTIGQGIAMVREVRKHGAVFQTGSQQRSEWGGIFRHAAELVRNGRIGRVYRATVGVGIPPRECELPAEPEPSTIDWDMWLGPAPWRPYHGLLADKMWRPYRDYCGGGLADMGAHHFDIAAWALGLDHTGPSEIIPPADPAADRGAILRYPDGLELEHVVQPSGTVFHGSDGTLHIDRDVFRASHPDIIRQPLGASDIHLPRARGHHDDWLAAIRTRTDPIAPVEVGHRTATLCHLLNIAYTLRRPLKWNPDQEMFVNDRQAERFMDRAMRAPWRV